MFNNFLGYNIVTAVLSYCECLTKKLISSHKLKFLDPYIFATSLRKPLLFQT